MDGSASPSIDPLSDSVPHYLDQIAELLRTMMPEAWQWAASDQLADEDAESMRLDLLRSSIRLDKTSHADIYDIAESTAKTLGLESSVTIYQQQNPIGWNAGAMLLGNAAHIVLHGPLTKELTRPELTAVLAHELGHVLLWKMDDAKHGIAHRLLESLASDPSAAQPHLESARLAKLYAEVFCDRIAHHVVGESSVVISSLLKIGTQSAQVAPEEYLKQAEEILATDNQASRHGTHPEMYLRAKAIEAWSNRKAHAKSNVEEMVFRMIQGHPALESLDLVAQSDLATLTRQILDAIFRHQWFRTEAALAHARLFFDDYTPSNVSPAALKKLSAGIAAATPSIKKYVGYLLLDFATSERECEDVPLAAALDLADRFSISESFQELAKKELRLRVKQIRDLDQKRDEMLAAAEKGTGQ